MTYPVKEFNDLSAADKTELAKSPSYSSWRAGTAESLYFLEVTSNTVYRIVDSNPDPDKENIRRDVMAMKATVDAAVANSRTDYFRANQGVAAVNTKVDSMAPKIADATREIAKHEGVLGKVLQALEGITEIVGTLQDRLDDLEQKKTRAEKRNGELLEELQESSERIDELETELANSQPPPLGTPAPAPDAAAQKKSDFYVTYAPGDADSTYAAYDAAYERILKQRSRNVDYGSSYGI